jgi:hypothetical protein
MEREFELFLREKKYIKNVLQYTVEFCQYSINVLGKYCSIKSIFGINKANPIDFIAVM